MITNYRYSIHHYGREHRFLTVKRRNQKKKKNWVNQTDRRNS